MRVAAWIDSEPAAMTSDGGAHARRGASRVDACAPRHRRASMTRRPGAAAIGHNVAMAPHAGVLLALAALASAAGAQRTWVVDSRGGAGVDFLQIQPAIDAAQPRDRIEVQAVASSRYASFLLTKGIDIDGVGGVADVYASAVRATPPGHTARLSNLRFSSDHPFSDIGLRIETCAGPVLLRFVVVLGQWGWHACRVSDSPNVMISFASLEAAGALSDVRAGLLVERSTVNLRTSNVQGGGSSIQRGVGGPAVRIDDSSLVVADSSLVGGRGGPALAIAQSCLSTDPNRGGPGGSGLEGNGRAVVIAQSSLTGGLAGLTSLFLHPSCAGVPGPSVNMPQGVAIVSADSQLNGGFVGVVSIAEQPTLSVPPRVPVGSPFTASMTAPAGSGIKLFASLEQAHEVIGLLPVPRLVEFPTFAVATAATGASGQVSVVLTLPSDPSTRNACLFFQCIASTPTGIAFSNSAELSIR